MAGLDDQQLMVIPEFKDMYGAIQHHYHDVKLAHLTGTARDMITRAQRDTKFYDVLVKMLCELNQTPQERGRLSEDLRKVYTWYQANKHVLQTGPIFGKSFRKSQTKKAVTSSQTPGHITLMRSESLNISRPMTCSRSNNRRVPDRERPNTTVLMMLDDSPTHTAGRSSPASLEDEPSPEHFYLNLEAWDTDAKRHKLSRPKTPAQTMYAVPEQDLKDFVPQTMIHPISSLVNPHAYEDDKAHVRATSPVKFRTLSGQMPHGSLSGTPFNPSHNNTSTPENITSQIITGYLSNQSSQLNHEGKRSVLKQPLEKFYATTSTYYPHKPRSTRASRERPQPLGRQLLDHEERTESSGDPERHSSDVRLDALVAMIDDVSGSMMYHKEQIPALQNGISMEVIDSDMNGNSDQLLASPRSCKSSDTAKPEPARRVLSPRPATTQLCSKKTECIDWRGKITPDTVGCRWNKKKFGGHTYVKNFKKQSPLPGSTSVGKRPKSAPVSVKEKWKTENPSDQNSRPVQAATHATTVVDQDAMDSIFVVSHLLDGQDVSGYGSYGSLFDFDEELNRKRHFSAATSTTTLPLEYVSFVATKTYSAAGARPYSQISTVEDTKTEGSRFDSAISELSIRLTDDSTTGGDYARHHYGGSETNSAVAGYEQPDFGDLEDDLRDTDIAETHENATLNDSADFVNTEHVSNTINLTEFDHTVSKERFQCPTESNIGLESNVDDTSIINDLLTKALVRNQKNQYEDKIHFGRIKSAPLLPGRFPDKSKSRLSQSFLSKYNGDRTCSALCIKGENWLNDNSILMPGKTSRVQGQVTPDPHDAQFTSSSRVAGRMAPGTHSVSAQMVRMSQKQAEFKRRAAGLKTSPSIPSPHHAYGSRTPRHGQTYNAELDHQARGMSSPRHYMEHVGDLRSEVATEGNVDDHLASPDPLRATLQVCKLHAPVMNQNISPHQMAKSGKPMYQMSVQGDGAKAPLSQAGRPAPLLFQVADPMSAAASVERQREAVAAVDIQRIFRGFVARNYYKMLQREEREKREDQQKAAIEIQRRYRGHIARKSAILRRAHNPETLEWSRAYKTSLQEKAMERQEKMDVINHQNTMNHFRSSSRLQTIGPHVEIYDVYHQLQTGPTNKQMRQAAIKIQKNVRGWLLRRTFDKLKRKATYLGLSWSKMVREYKDLLIRVQTRHGIERPKVPFSIEEMNDFIETRKKYESTIEKRSFGGEVDLDDLPHILHECGLYPPRGEVDNAFDVVFRGQPLWKGHGLEKSQVMEIIYHIYVPKATGLQTTRESTWMNPIVDGIEARTLLGPEIKEETPWTTCAHMIIDSKRERRLRAERENEARNGDDTESSNT